MRRRLFSLSAPLFGHYAEYEGYEIMPDDWDLAALALRIRKIADAQDKALAEELGLPNIDRDPNSA